MDEKEHEFKHKKYQKKNEFTFKMIFNNQGDALETIVERAFGNYCLKIEK